MPLPVNGSWFYKSNITFDDTSTTDPNMTGPGDFFCRAVVGLPLWTDDVAPAPDAGFFLRRLAAGRDVSVHNTVHASNY